MIPADSVLQSSNAAAYIWFNPGHAKRLVLTLGFLNFKVRGENMMFTMPPRNSAGNPSTVTVLAQPVKADGTPSTAKLSNVVYSSSDATVFTVAPDPATPNGGIITAVANPPVGQTASAVLTATATATEPDGVTTETISGTATIVLSTPPPAPAAALTFLFGTPQ